MLNGREKTQKSQKYTHVGDGLGPAEGMTWNAVSTADCAD
jgi:hypothetical protein